MTKQIFEGGFTMISNGLLEAMMRYPSSGLKKDILLFLIRYSYGYQRNTVEIPVKELSENLKRPKNKVGAALRELIRDKIIEVVRNYDAAQKPRIISLNTNSEQWNSSEKLDKKLQSTKRSAVDQKGNRTDPQKVHSTESQKVHSYRAQGTANKGRNSTPKKSLKKEKKIYSPNSVEFRLSDLLLRLIKQKREEFREPDLQKWCTHMNRLIKFDKRSPEEIERVIIWCQNDNFWYKNILSTDSLRKQYDRLAIIMDSETGQYNSCIKNKQSVSESDRIRL